MKNTTKKLINAGLAGALVLLGSCSGGIPTLQELFIAFIAGAIVALTQFRDLINGVPKSKKAQIKIFNFLNL